MKLQNHGNRIVLLILSALLLLSLVACAAPLEIESGIKGTSQISSVPAQTTKIEAEVTLPSSSSGLPPVTEPAATNPPVSKPPATQPAATEPTVKEPAPTEPVVTEPAVTEPVVTEPSQDTLVILSWPQEVHRNHTYTVTVKGKPNTEYSIVVNYKSGPASAAGLETKYSDADGYVSWTWKVGGRTSAGSFTIVVSGGGEQETVTFEVIVE